MPHLPVNQLKLEPPTSLVLISLHVVQCTVDHVLQLLDHITFPFSVILIMSLLENRVFVFGLIFHLYQVFLPTVQIRIFVPVVATTWYKCPLTGARRGLLQPTRL
jgi:hypothetical protein